VKFGVPSTSFDRESEGSGFVRFRRIDFFLLLFVVLGRFRRVDLFLLFYIFVDILFFFDCRERFRKCD
jgi:hypothetical protein